VKALTCEKIIKDEVEKVAKVVLRPVVEANTSFDTEIGQLQATIKTLGMLREVKAPQDLKQTPALSPLLLEGKFIRKSTISLSGPIGVCVSSQGDSSSSSSSDMIIAIVECRISRVSICGYNDLRVIRVLGTGTAGNGLQQFNNPHGGIVIHRDELFVTDCNNHRIQIFNLHSGVYNRTVGGEGKVKWPIGLAIRGDEMFITEMGYHRVSVWNHKNGNVIRQWGQRGSGDNDFHFGYSYLCLSPNGEELFVSDSNNNVIKVFNSNNGMFIRKFGKDQLNYPTGITVNNTHVYVADYNNNRIVVFNMSNGEMIKTFGSKGNGDGQFGGLYGITLANGQLIVADYSNGRIQWFQ